MEVKRLSLILAVAALVSLMVLLATGTKAQGDPTKIWPFTAPGNYTYNSTAIEVTGGYAQLKPLNSPAWWDTNYSYRERLMITNNSTSPLVAGHSIKTTVDTAALETGGKVRSDRRDWRIVYWNGSTNVELDRHYAGTAETWFALQADIQANSSDGNYYAYYGYSGETADPPSNQINVWHFWDDFSDGDISDWINYGSGAVVLDAEDGNYVLKKTANNDPNGGYVTFTTLSDYELTFLTDRINTSGGSQNRYGIEDSDLNGYGLQITTFTDSGQLGIERRAAGSGTTIASVPITGLGLNTWYRALFRRHEGDFYCAIYSYPVNELLYEVSVSNATYTSFDRFVVHGGYEYWIDDIRVRRYIEPEPSVTAGAEETAAYPTDAPTLQPTTGQDYAAIYSFAQTLGPKNEGEVRYQISNDGISWYYYDGSSWGWRPMVRPIPLARSMAMLLPSMTM